MKIRNQLLIGGGAVIILIVIFSAMVFTSFSQVTEESRKERIANRLYVSAAELDILMYDYLLHRQDRMKEQWRIKYSSLHDVLEEIEEYQDFEEIRDNYVQMENLFAEIVQNAETEENPYLEERLVAQMLIISHEIISESSEIAEQSYQNSERFRERTNIMLLISISILFVLVTAISLIIANYISKPLEEMVSSIEKISKGNLDVKLEKSNLDEVQSLVDALNRILASLKLAVEKVGVAKEEIGLGEALKA
ncbi:HAMP domain-containing protein, partial [Candidatus Woesearchaeota archaeon]|nr:HAMP domain-containing protein [Candidatus Woesearchaeota archaeon]